MGVPMNQHISRHPPTPPALMPPQVLAGVHVCKLDGAGEWAVLGEYRLG